MSTTQTTTAPVAVTPGVWEIDASHSNVEFVARHLLSKVRGRFAGFEGAITIGDDPSGSSVEATIDAASVDTGNPDRDAHLRSPDFLDVEQFPQLSFRSTAVTEDGEDRYRVDGDLTVRGVTRPVTLELEYLGWSDDPWGGKRAGFSAITEIDRHDFGATWNLAVETGGVVVGRKVRIELEIEAVLQAG
ncbi:MAG TPA: YceI family protein [Acidimicrobiia bacterium]|nr:YceI family protein [Acidimicrobiia bacterium]